MPARRARDAHRPHPPGDIAPRQAPRARTAPPCPRLTPARPPRAANRPHCVSPPALRPPRTSLLPKAKSSLRIWVGPSPGRLRRAGVNLNLICAQWCCSPGALPVFALLPPLHPFLSGLLLFSPCPSLGLTFSPGPPAAEQSHGRRRCPGRTKPLTPCSLGTVIVWQDPSALLFSPSEGSPYAWAAHGDAEQKGFAAVGWVAVSPSSRPRWRRALAAFSAPQRPGCGRRSRFLRAPRAASQGLLSRGRRRDWLSPLSRLPAARSFVCSQPLAPDLPQPLSSQPRSRQLPPPPQPRCQQRRPQGRYCRAPFR